MLRESLGRALEDNQNDFEDGDIPDMIQLRFQREGEESTEEGHGTCRHVLIDFALELPDETEQMREVVEAFAKSLAETPPIFHVVKFEDPLLKAELADRASEIFSLEMKLRRILSIIYLQAYQDEKPFDLLRDESEQPLSKRELTEQQMQAAIENQFFHLTFGQYTNLNQRPSLKQADLLAVIRDSESYEALHGKLLKVPVEHERDAEFLATLKSLMNPIEGMRNSVAHNRRPSKKIAQNYPSARTQLEQSMDEFLEGIA